MQNNLFIDLRSDLSLIQTFLPNASKREDVLVLQLLYDYTEGIKIEEHYKDFITMNYKQPHVAMMEIANQLLVETESFLPA